MTSISRKERTKQMTLCLFPKILIPSDWTGDQAKAIVDFLDEISSAIWDTHEAKIMSAMNLDESLLERVAKEDDDAPSDDTRPRSQNQPDAYDDLPF